MTTLVLDVERMAVVLEALIERDRLRILLVQSIHRVEALELEVSSMVKPRKRTPKE